MDRRIGLILTLLSVLLCACPGLTLCSSGYYVLSGSIGANGLVATLAGISAVVSGVLMSIIPLVLAVVTWRLPDRPLKPVTPEELDEKLPPAI
jgi:membrane protein implicated in regulation of membrane protease activity